ncbi:MAG: hypothetical protein ACC628_11915 [Pirellulaceae bacterium]
MAIDMQDLIVTQELSLSVIQQRTQRIHAQVLRNSVHADGENFTAIHPADLERMFDLYDRSFFERGCRRLLGEAPLTFRLSKRMTSVAGSTTRTQKKNRRKGVTKARYEITISTTLLFQTFREQTRPIVVNGIRCRNRMDALQRVMEHELVHLLEMLIWTYSRCSAKRFQSIAYRFFGHTDYTHQLITPCERAMSKYGIRSGDRVSFRFDGRHLVGIVNRITRRATVLVEDAKGECYSDGKKYQKFYVPLTLLKAVDRERT